MIEYDWDIDGSESDMCFPHSADVDKLWIEGRYRLSTGDEEGDWKEFSNTAEEDEQVRLAPHTVMLFEEESNWTTMELELAVYIPDPERHSRHVMHPDDEEYHGLFGASLISSKGTKFQTRFREWHSGEQREGRSDLKIRLRRSDLAGQIALHPRCIFAASLGEEPLDGKARRKSSIIGTGPSVHFQVDEPEHIPGGDINHRWDEFGGDMRGAMTYLRVIDAEITCLWNNEFKRLKPYIDSKTRTGKLATPREAIFAQERVKIVRTLASWAVTNYDEELEHGEAKLAERILRRCSKWTSFSRDSILSMHGHDGGTFDPDEITTFNARLQDHFKLAGKTTDIIKMIEKLREG